MLEERIQQFRTTVEEPASGFEEDTREMALELLSVVGEMDTRADPSTSGRLGVPGETLQRISANLREVVDQLRFSLSVSVEHADSALLSWVQSQLPGLINLVVDAYREAERRGTAEGFFQWVDWTDRLRRLQDHLTRRLDSDALQRRTGELVAKAEAALQSVEDARDKAQGAAGLTGNAALGTYFSNYADKELSAARWFRGLTIAAIIMGLCGVLAQGHLEPGDWTGVTFRLAVAAGAGTLAAYFGRQSGQHRRLYNWARSTQVQLESFPAFIEGVPAEEQGEVYRTLARRILGAPPEKGGDSSEDSAGSAQLLDLVATLARRQLS